MQNVSECLYSLYVWLHLQTAKIKLIHPIFFSQKLESNEKVTAYINDKQLMQKNK